MKTLFKSPLFYLNIILLVVLFLLITSVNVNQTKLPNFLKKTIAAVQTITGEGNVNYLAAFSSTNQIGNSIIYDNGTNVGIGTTNPQGKLHVTGGILRLNNNDIVFQSNDTGDIIFQNANGTQKARVWAGVGDGVNELYLSSADTISDITITSSGKVEIPNGGVLNSIAVGSDKFGALSYPYESIQLPSWANLRINFGSKERMIITSLGNVGIGTNWPSQKLDVSGVIQAGSVRLYGGDSNNWNSVLAPAFISDGSKTGVKSNDFYVANSSGTGYANLYANYVVGQSGLCIGNDCRTSWPSGGGGGGGGGFLYVQKVFSGVNCDANFYGVYPDGKRQWLGGYWGEWGCNAPTTQCSRNPSGPVSNGCTITMNPQ
jgi:hypothetical protein